MAYTPHVSKPKPPMKGAFPLDHDGECKSLMQNYLRCLREQGHVATQCREWSGQYLKCRMEHNLMAPEEMRRLGFTEEADRMVHEFNEKLKTMK